jgi:hypothetical protein
MTTDPLSGLPRPRNQPAPASWLSEAEKAFRRIEAAAT